MKPSEILKGIKAGDRNEEHGICYSFRVNSKYKSKLSLSMMDAGIDFEDWPHFSGNVWFPVPSGNRIHPHFYYSKVTRNKWNPKTNYGALRLDLLDWLIEQFEEAGQ